MFCEKCGYQLPDDAKFCEKCGSPVTALRGNGSSCVHKEDKAASTSVKVKKKHTKMVIGVTVGVVVLVFAGIILVIKLSGMFADDRVYKDGENVESVGDEDSGISKVSEADFFEIYEFEIETESNETIQEENALKETVENTTQSGNVLENEHSVKENQENDNHPAVVTAAPVQETTRESTYEFVKGNYTWIQAHQECVKRGGHLVHFDTPGEVEKVISMFTQKGYDNKSMFWIGGARNSGADSYSYHWVDADGTYGEEISLSDNHWMKNEPSYIDSGLDNLVEDKMMLFFYKDENRWVWNDEYNSPQDYMPAYKERIGFICEYEK